MKITSIAVDQKADHRKMYVGVELDNNEDLEQGDLDRIMNLLREEQGAGTPTTNEDADEQRDDEEKPKRGRGRPRKQADDAEEKPKRGRGRPKAGGSAEDGEEEEPKRTTRGRRKQVEEPQGDENEGTPEITDAILMRAAAKCTRELKKLGEEAPGDVILDICTMFGVEEVNKVPQESRAEFLDALKAEYTED